MATWSIFLHRSTQKVPGEYRFNIYLLSNWCPWSCRIQLNGISQNQADFIPLLIHLYLTSAGASKNKTKTTKHYYAAQQNFCDPSHSLDNCNKTFSFFLIRSSIHPQREFENTERPLLVAAMAGRRSVPNANLGTLFYWLVFVKYCRWNANLPHNVIANTPF